MRSIILQRVYSAMCFLLAGLFGWGTVHAYLKFWPLDAEGCILNAIACIVFLSTAVFVLRRSEIGAWLAGFTGALLVLLTTAVLLVAWGYRGTIPTALVTGSAGALGIYLAAKIDRPPA